MGRRKEQEVAKLMGGRRNVMSGGSVMGGGDLVFASDDPFNDWSWEVKARKLLPEIVKLALRQAEAEGGARKRPAAVICPDGVAIERAVVYFYLGDFVTWARALAEVGSGWKLKAIVRQMQAQLKEMEATL